jgi:hypothetical protein
MPVIVTATPSSSPAASTHSFETFGVHKTISGLSTYMEKQFTQLQDDMKDIRRTQASLAATQASLAASLAETQTSLASQIRQLAEKVDKISDALDGRHSSESDVWRHQRKASSSSVGTRESPEPITFTRLSTDSNDESKPSNIAVSIPVVSVQDVDSNRAQAQEDVRDAQAAMKTVSSRLKKISSFLVLHTSCTNRMILISVHRVCDLGVNGMASRSQKCILLTSTQFSYLSYPVRSPVSHISQLALCRQLFHLVRYVPCPLCRLSSVFFFQCELMALHNRGDGRTVSRLDVR